MRFGKHAHNGVPVRSLLHVARSPAFPLRRHSSCNSSNSVRTDLESCSARAAWAWSTRGSTSSTGQPAAVKVLSPSLAAEEGFRVRFEAEIESLKKLRHPNIVRLYGYGEQAGTLFYAMELVYGTSLEEEVRAGRRFDWREVTQIGVKLCRALKHAHDHGVIHRDLKPANVLLTADGDVKLSDFGIARLFGNTRLTADGGVLGTAEYMAPEQAAGQVVTDRCDQYSLGGVLYALLAGRPPFRAKTLVEMLQLQRYADPDPVTRYAPQTPAELARIIHQLLEKDPPRRFSNTLILGRSLEAMERGLSISASRGDDCVLSSPDQPAPGVRPSSQTPTLSPTELAALGELDVSRAGDFDETAATMAYGQEAPPRPRNPRRAPRLSRRRRRTPAAGDLRRSTSRREPLAAGGDDEQTRFFSPANRALGPFAGLVDLCRLVPDATPQRRPACLAILNRQPPRATSNSSKPTLPKIEQFLVYYSDDPRADAVGHCKRRPVKPTRVQRAYTEAKRLAVLNPDLAAVRFQALIDVYGDDRDASDTARHFVKLARIKLKDLQKQLAQRVRDDRQVLESPTRAGPRTGHRQPGSGQKIFAGIVALYDDKPWAMEQVTRARAGLTQIDSARAAVEK